MSIIPLVTFLAIDGDKALSSILGIIGGGLGVAIFTYFANKKKEAIDLANAVVEGENVVVQVKTNIDKLIAEKTKAFAEEIQTYKDTILQISVRGQRDADHQILAMAKLEKRIDDQMSRTDRAELRNDDLEKQIVEEIRIREDCLKQLSGLQRRVYDLEKISSPVSNLQKNNPDNKDNTLHCDDEESESKNL